MKRAPLFLSLILLGLAMGLLLCQSTPAVGLPSAAASSAPAAIHTVCPSGPPDCDLTSVQAAVDAAQDGDLIKVAAGTYQGVSARPCPYWPQPPSGLITQVVYISIPVTIQGGYTTDDWDVPDPVANPTILDAEGEGRVLVVGPFIDAHVEGLRLVNGNAAGLGGHFESDAGGDALVLFNTATLSNCQIMSGTAAFGGGLYLSNSDSTLVRNTVVDNTTLSDGAGVYLMYGTNHLSGNAIQGNAAGGCGGGLHLDHGQDLLDQNIISGNEADRGGGAWASFSLATLDGNVIVDNDAVQNGAGLYLWTHAGALRNNVLADNVAGNYGNDIYFEAGSPRLVHNTIAHRSLDPGWGIYAADSWGAASSPVLTNTILAGHDVAVYALDGCTVTLEATLWGAGGWANGSDWQGPGTILTGTINVWGNPHFRAPGAGDYHISPCSPAVDAGVDAGITHDMDADARPSGAGLDIGADEVTADMECTRVYLPLVMREQ